MSNNMMSVSASEREAFFDTLKKMKNELDDKTEAIVALLDELDEASLSICSQDIHGIIMLKEELQTATAALERASAESMELGKSCSAILNELTGALAASSML